MNADRKAPSFPRGPLYAAGFLLAVSVIGVAFARLIGYQPDAIPVSAVVEHRDLKFEDRMDGSVAVTDAATGRAVVMLEPGTNAFLRATLRGLAQERMRQNIGSATPFRLTRWADGRLSLDDPDTGRHVELGAFGPTNAQAFARLLASQESIR